MEHIEILGLVAATLTTGAFVPQVYKTLINKSVKDISLSMYTVLLMRLLLWIVYGFYINSLPIIAANIITATLSVLIVITKIEYK